LNRGAKRKPTLCPRARQKYLVFMLIPNVCSDGRHWNFSKKGTNERKMHPQLVEILLIYGPGLRAPKPHPMK
jgi:hypothetical protein